MDPLSNSFVVVPAVVALIEVDCMVVVMVLVVANLYSFSLYDWHFTLNTIKSINIYIKDVSFIILNFCFDFIKKLFFIS